MVHGTDSQMSRRALFVGVLLCVLFVAATAIAQSNPAPGNAGILLDAENHLKRAAAGWGNVIFDAAIRLFWSLATISLVWTMGQLSLRKAEIGEFFSEFVRFIMFTGFWFWMLESGPEFAQAIIDSFADLAAQASGRSSRSAGNILTTGFVFLGRILGELGGITDIPVRLGGILMGFVILALFALIAVNLLILKVSAWLVAYAGIFVLGFGGSRWTSEMAMAYYKTMLGLGLQIMTMMLLVGIGEDLVTSYMKSFPEGLLKFTQVAEMLVVAIIVFVLVNKLPPMVGALVVGGNASHALGSGAGAAAAMAAGGLAASKIAGAVGAMKTAEGRKALMGKAALGTAALGTIGAPQVVAGMAAAGAGMGAGAFAASKAVDMFRGMKGGGGGDAKSPPSEGSALPPAPSSGGQTSQASASAATNTGTSAGSHTNGGSSGGAENTAASGNTASTNGGSGTQQQTASSGNGGGEQTSTRTSAAEDSGPVAAAQGGSSSSDSDSALPAVASSGGAASADMDSASASTSGDGSRSAVPANDSGQRAAAGSSTAATTSPTPGTNNASTGATVAAATAQSAAATSNTSASTIQSATSNSSASTNGRGSAQSSASTSTEPAAGQGNAPSSQATVAAASSGGNTNNAAAGVDFSREAPAAQPQGQPAQQGSAPVSQNKSAAQVAQSAGRSDLADRVQQPVDAVSRQIDWEQEVKDFRDGKDA